MSTNDTVIALANGRAGARDIARDGADFDEAAGDAGRPVRRAGARHRRRRRGGDEAAGRRRRAARPSASWRAISPARSPGGSLVKSGIFGGDPSWGRILAALGARVGARGLPLDLARRDARHPGRARLREGRARSRSTPRRCRRCMKKAEIAVRLDLGAGKESARVARLRPDLRLREDQRRVLHAARRAAAEPREARRGRRQPAAGRRGAELHPQVRRQARGHQVRRRGDGRPGAEAQLRRGGGAAAVGGPQAGDRPRRRPGDHQDAGEAGAEVGVRRRASASPARTRSRWWRWC